MLTELSGVEAMHLVSTEGPRRMIQLNIWVSSLLRFLLLFVFTSYSPKWGNATTWLVLRRDVVVGRQTQAGTRGGKNYALAQARKVIPRTQVGGCNNILCRQQVAVSDSVTTVLHCDGLIYKQPVLYRRLRAPTALAGAK